MDGPSPFGILTMVPDELRQFATLAPLATISPVSASVGATPPLSGPMPESTSPDAHVRFSVENTCTVATNAADGIGTLIDAALKFADLFESTDGTNAATQQSLAGQLSSALNGRSSSGSLPDSPCYIPDTSGGEGAGDPGAPTIGPEADSSVQA